jgi:hypothetical protein
MYISCLDIMSSTKFYKVVISLECDVLCPKGIRSGYISGLDRIFDIGDWGLGETQRGWGSQPDDWDRGRLKG